METKKYNNNNGILAGSHGLTEFLVVSTRLHAFFLS